MNKLNPLEISKINITNEVDKIFKKACNELKLDCSDIVNENIKFDKRLKIFEKKTKEAKPEEPSKTEIPQEPPAEEKKQERPSKVTVKEKPPVTKKPTKKFLGGLRGIFKKERDSL